jgi:RimJ/RimL family protein N-acetyltransferase
VSAPDPLAGIRVGRLSDFRGLAALYNSRTESDRSLFHPFPGGILAWFVFFALLLAQGAFRVLVRIRATWGFAFVVLPGEARGTIDGFVYMRVRRRTPAGYVANIGTQVGPRARGKGIGPRMILALAAEARRLGACQIETEAYAWNAASLRMGEKLGMREPEDPKRARRPSPRGEIVTLLLDLDGLPSPTTAPRMPPPDWTGYRLAMVSDFWALGRLYASRDDADRRQFHPFPGGRLGAPVVFLILLVVQSLRRLLIRIRPSWAFAFVAYSGTPGGPIEGFVYLRGRHRLPNGYAANIGTQVSPRARGKSVGQKLIVALIDVAQTLRITRFETEAYEQNIASIRMCEKVGFHLVDQAPEERTRNRYGPEVHLVMDLPVRAGPATLPGAAPSPPTAPRWVHALTALALFTAFGVIVALRLQILFSYPFPSGGDVAEQLYWSHIWLGTAFPSQVTVWWIPPVYIWTVYIPFTHVFPLFTGQRLLMGTVPALLLFPAYFLLREAQVNRVFSLFGASLLALAAPLSLMATWNAGYNLFGMFCALVCFAGLIGALRTHRGGYILVAAGGFGLTAGAHDFTFAFLCLGIVLTAILAFLLLRGRRATGRTLALIALAGAFFVAPFTLVYLTLTAQTSNVGGAVTSGALNALAQQFFPFVWSGGSVWTSLIEVDTIVSVLGIVALLAARPRKPETPVLLGILLSGTLLSAAYPQLPERGLYFVPLGLYPMIAVLLQVVWDVTTRSRSGGAAGAAAPSAPTASPPRASPASVVRARPRLSRRVWIVGTAAVVVMAVLLVANAQESMVAMNTGEQFYAILSANDLPALNWLAHNTSKTAAVYTPEAGFEKWIWGYANRESYAPQPLSLEDTTLSIQETYAADLISLGQYVSTDPYLAVAQNSPSPIGTPVIYLHSQYFWTLLFNTGASNISLTLSVGGQTEVANLDTAILLSHASTTPCANCTGDDLTFTWAGTSVNATEQTNLTGQAVSIGWKVTGATLEGVNLTTYIAPPDFGTIHTTVPHEVNATGLTDKFSFQNTPFSVTFHGTNATFSQSRLTDGWDVVSFAGKNLLKLQFSGLVPYGNAAPATTDTATLWSSMGVTYVLTNYYDSVPGFGYLVYLRCATPGEEPGITITQVFESGGLYIFSVSGT